MPSSQEILGEGGLLKNVLAHFKPRSQQQEMAEAIERGIEINAQLVIEAGTGTGKTFAYLVPAFLSEKKTIISTGTKNLQDQLFFKDIPIIKSALGFTKKIVLLKGRSNYLCQYRLIQSQEDGRYASRDLVNQLQLITEWSVITKIGDISEIKEIAEDSPIWPYVTSTIDNCLNQDCEFYNECFVVKARQQALSADVVIVNHYLFFADMALQEEGFGELLPGAELIIFDEAHHLPDIASQFFSTTLTSRQLLEVARDTEAEGLNDAKDMLEIGGASTQLQMAVQDLRLAFGSELRRAPWPTPLRSELQLAIDKVKKRLMRLDEILKPIAVRGKGLENCSKRVVQMIEKFNLLTSESPTDAVHWYETYLQSFTLHFTPMVVADYFKKFLNGHKRTWVFTSATLAVGSTFRHFTEVLGLEKALQLKLSTPFDYSNQALLYVPRGLSDPRDANFPLQLVDNVLPILEITQGRAFLLFTSYKIMELVAEALKDKISFPVLLQGSMPKKDLIEQFKHLKNAVLLGTSSFWYGVDVKGKTLSCVVIDKLPFAAPDDPILQAKIRLLRKQGLDPFKTLQLPQAVLTLKQGVGRLIRDSEDRGILVICDPRLVANRYGQVFLENLPNMPRTRDLTKVQKFFEVENTNVTSTKTSVVA